MTAEQIIKIEALPQPERERLVQDAPSTNAFRRISLKL
jgi:hypothetical protein